MPSNSLAPSHSFSLRIPHLPSGPLLCSAILESVVAQHKKRIQIVTLEYRKTEKK